MTQTPGPKEQRRRELREDRHAKKAGKKPSVSELRGRVASVKPKKGIKK